MTAARPAAERDPAAAAAPAAAARSRPLFGRLWRGYLAPHRGTMALAFAVLLVEGATLGALSWLLKPLFDEVFAPGGDGLLVWVGLAILGLFVLRAASSVVARTLMARIAQDCTMALQVDLLRHLLTLDLRFFQANPPGALIERVQGDTVAVQAVWSAIITGAGRDVIGLVGLFAVALAIDPVWTAAALVGAPLLVLPVAAVQRYIRRKTRRMREEAGRRATRLDEVFHGIEAVKLYRLEAYQTERFRRIVAGIRRAELRMAAGRSTIPALIDVITGVGFFLVLMLAGREIAAGTRSTGDFMAFFTAMALTFQPIRRLGDLTGLWQVAAASLERVFGLFDTAPAARPTPTGRLARAAGTAPRIALQEVSFAFPGHPVLDAVSFTAEPGAVTALVGPSGAGKSTIFALLTGLEQPSAGRILIDGVDAATLPLDRLRAEFAVVSQNPGLFDETIRENVTLGRDTDPAQLAAALEAAHVASFAAALPGGLDAAAGPRGTALSGGQRQRVAIARALLADAPVLLLDEATSALDAASEALVGEALARLSQGRTTLVIAHRLATIREAAKIVVLDRGRVVDQGTHGELLARGGLYAELCRLQFRE
jgi:ATP-binding cassette subfamily B protein/subfamily B ATP-binding cassette protein MsbA